MRRRAAAAAMLVLAAATARAADSSIALRIANDAGVPAAQLQSRLASYPEWARRVYRYHQVRDPAPVTLRLTREVPVAMYRDGEVLLPADDEPGEMLESWVHELTHHAVGPDSSFFFKEGLAVHTLEALLEPERRIPQGWPGYGQPADAWVRLFRERGRLPRLRDALAWPGWRGDTPDGDFASWQVYVVAGSFVGWYRARHGAAKLREAFRREWPAQDSAVLETEWLAAVAAHRLPPFDPARALPDTPRFRAYVERLASR